MMTCFLMINTVSFRTFAKEVLSCCCWGFHLRSSYRIPKLKNVLNAGSLILVNVVTLLCHLVLWFVHGLLFPYSKGDILNLTISALSDTIN